MKKGKRWAVWLGLFALMSLILIGTNLWAQKDRGAGVVPEALPDSLKEMNIKDNFVPSSFKKAGVIHALRGHVVVIHRGTGEAYFGVAGDYIYENDSINTLDDSRCRIKLFNDDVATMAPNTEFSVDTYSDNRKEHKKVSLFGMLKGKVKFFALRLLRYKEAKVTVKTPTAIVGVRGTSFGIHVYGLEEGRTAQAGIKVADSGNAIGTYLAQVGPGGTGRSGTDVLALDGCVDVGGAKLCTGQISRNGVTEDLGPEEMYYFICDTNMEGCKKFPKKLGERLWEKFSEGQGADAAALLAKLLRDQIYEEVSAVSAGKGYFAAMLDPAAAWLHDVYVSQDRDTGTVKSESIRWPNNSYLEADAGFTQLTRIVSDNGTVDSGTSTSPNPQWNPPPPYPIEIHKNTASDAISFMEWGYWMTTTGASEANPVTTDDGDLWITDRGYYIRGDVPDWNPQWSGSLWYYGNAEGQYYDDPNEMTGWFESEVDFDNRTVPYFWLSIDNGQASAAHRAAEVFGYGGFEANSTQFVIDDIVGATLKNGGSNYWPGKVSVHGSLFDKDKLPAQEPSHMGGAGGMYYDDQNGAVFIFHGGQCDD